MQSKYYFFAHHILPYALFKQNLFFKNKTHFFIGNNKIDDKMFQKNYIELWYNMHIYGQMATEVLAPVIENIKVGNQKIYIFSLPNQKKALEGEWGMIIEQEKKVRYLVYEKGIRGGYYLNEWSEDGKCKVITYAYGMKTINQMKSILKKILSTSSKQKRGLLQAV
jgi:hypothetical protein